MYLQLYNQLTWRVAVMTCHIATVMTHYILSPSVVCDDRGLHRAEDKAKYERVDNCKYKRYYIIVLHAGCNYIYQLHGFNSRQHLVLATKYGTLRRILNLFTKWHLLNGIY